ncbi:MAG: hypothetical protein IMF09_13045 [Proteobacteria bacterium]|nr:hypothetical protein [Pseudomonadota bacterium]
MSPLFPLIDHFYAYGMVEWGPAVIRTIDVGIMLAGSISLYFVYKNIFGITNKVALPAALLPNILPSLIGIPMGLNASYAIWTLPPILISMLLMQQAFARNNWSAYLCWFFGVLAYAIGLNLAMSSTFLIPVVLSFLGIFLMVSREKIKPAIFSLPFLSLSFWQLYRHKLTSHKELTDIPIDVMLDRASQFIEMGSFLPFNNSISLITTVILMLIGLAGVIVGSVQLFTKPIHFGFKDKTYRVILILWLLSWWFGNSIAYIVVSPTFRVFDYAYIANFSTVLLQIFGIVFLWQGISHALHLRKSHTMAALLFLFIGILTFTAIQKFERIKFVINEPSKISSVLRSELGLLDIPDETQILIFGAPTTHAGNYSVNTGYIRYLLQRNDVSAIFAQEAFPHDVFSKSKTFLDTMKDFNVEKPTLAFTLVNGKLVQRNLLLQTRTTGLKALPRLQWSLFDISRNGHAPIKIASGKGLPAYHTYIENKLEEGYTAEDIIFSPKPNSGLFISQLNANDIVADEFNLIKSDISFDQTITLRSARKITTNSETTLELLLRIGALRPNLLLGYSINQSWPKKISLLEMAMEGDNILIKIPIEEKDAKSAQVSVRILNIGHWPYKSLLTTDNNEALVIKADL